VSGLFDGDERSSAGTASESGGRSRALLITTGVLIVGFLLFTGLSTFWTERMWFSSVDYSSVFARMLWTRVGLFVVFGVVMTLAVGASMALAYRTRPIFRPASAEQSSLDRYRDAVTPIRRWLMIGISVLMGAFAGTSAAGEWRNFMLWRHAVPFGKSDPYFGRDIGFYVFSLPWWHFVVDFAMVVAFLALLAGAVVHYLYGGIRLQATHDRISGAAAVHLSVILGLFMVFKAVDYWLDRFDVLTGSGKLIDGMSYTDDNAVIPAKNILLGIAAVCAVLFFLNIWRRSWMLPSVGVALYVLSAILLGLIWPGIVQQFQVNPSEPNKEAPYISKTITATRDAFNLGDISVEKYDQAVAEPSVDALSAATSAVPLIDPKLVRDNFEQNQQQQGYYTVADVLDVDRYRVDGTDRALVLGVRELDQSGLAESNKNWSNLHTVYTHGYGVIAAYGNQRDEADKVVKAETTPYAESGLPPKGSLTDQQDGYRGAIYFGEQSPPYSIVGKRSDGADVEFDLPESSGSDKGTTTTYDGKAGVPVGGLWNQLLYAVKFGDPNIVLSSRVNSNSKIIYDRDPTQRVKKVAPWLQIDRDPYPAVVDGKVVWILDGFTTTDRYPLSDKQSFDDMTNDSLADTSQFQALPTDEINYMRNAVKATVDAYDGTVTLYEWDESDPMLKAWMAAFPNTVEPKSAISDDLLTHLRYPEDLFKVQRYQFARYHVTDSSDWYEGNDRWQVPQDPDKAGDLQPPYRMFIDNPDTATAGSTFSMTSVYTPYKRDNLVGFMDVNSDATQAEYGKLRVLRSPGPNIPGPGQVANSFANDEDVKAALFKFSGSGTKARYGNLLTLPVDGKLLYVQPVYTVRNSQASYPILNAVITSFGETGARVGFGGSLPEAIADLLGGTLTPEPDPGTDPGTNTGGTLPAQVRRLLNQADAAFKAADAAFADGDTVTWAEQTKRGRDLVEQAIVAADK
jgi:uncharacterized protein